MYRDLTRHCELWARRCDGGRRERDRAGRREHTLRHAAAARAPVVLVNGRTVKQRRPAGGSLFARPVICRTQKIAVREITPCWAAYMKNCVATSRCTCDC
jgi:hypothetical protein